MKVMARGWQNALEQARSQPSALFQPQVLKTTVGQLIMHQRTLTGSHFAVVYRGHFGGVRPLLTRPKKTFFLSS